jgi:DNA-binding NtrC family response regulator
MNRAELSKISFIDPAIPRSDSMPEHDDSMIQHSHENRGLRTTDSAHRVLLAEDDRELRWLIARTLRQEGLEVVEVHDGLELLDRVGVALLDNLELDSIDLIVSDVHMPGWSGLEVLAGLNSAGCRTPVVLITAFGDAEIHAAARRLGAIAVLDKPFQLDDLRTLVVRTIEQRSLQ